MPTPDLSSIQMTMKDIITLTCSVTSLIISCLAFVFARIQETFRVQIFASVKVPFRTLVLEVVNNGKKPLTIINVIVYYGGTPDEGEGQIVFETNQGLPHRLTEGDLWVRTLDRDLLLESCRAKGVRQSYRSWPSFKLA